jgi:hypothetical protein
LELASARCPENADVQYASSEMVSGYVVYGGGYLEKKRLKRGMGLQFRRK